MEHDRTSLGAYALGALDPVEARLVHEHLAGCAECRREVAEFVELRRALDQVPPEAFLDGPPEQGDLLLQRTLRLVRAEAPPQPLAEPRPRRGWSPAVVAASVVLVAAALSGGVLIGRNTAPSSTVAQPPTSTVPANARTAEVTDPATGATMAVTLIPKAGWVWVNATVRGIAPGERCELRVVPRHGDALLAGSWLVSEQGAKEGTALQGTALIDPADVASVEVVTTDGRTMVSVSV